jgi:hypothetical protein
LSRAAHEGARWRKKCRDVRARAAADSSGRWARIAATISGGKERSGDGEESPAATAESPTGVTEVLERDISYGRNICWTK